MICITLIELSTFGFRSRVFVVFKGFNWNQSLFVYVYIYIYIYTKNDWFHLYYPEFDAGDVHFKALKGYYLHLSGFNIPIIRATSKSVTCDHTSLTRQIRNDSYRQHNRIIQAAANRKQSRWDSKKYFRGNGTQNPVFKLASFRVKST
jgi:hypothetical protein